MPRQRSRSPTKKEDAKAKHKAQPAMNKVVGSALLMQVMKGRLKKIRKKKEVDIEDPFEEEARENRRIARLHHKQERERAEARRIEAAKNPRRRKGEPELLGSKVHAELERTIKSTWPDWSPPPPEKDAENNILTNWKLLQALEDALETPGADRTAHDIDLLTMAFNRLGVFEKLQVLLDARSDFCRAANLRRMGAGEVAVRQGDPGDFFFLVMRGGMRVEKRQNGVDTHVATLFVGDTFGHLSLLHGVPRTATVVADLSSVLLVLERSAYDRYVKLWHVRQMKTSVAFLSELVPFDNWSKQQLELIASQMVLRRVDTGQVVAAQGEDSTELILILTGQCETRLSMAASGTRKTVDGKVLPTYSQANSLSTGMLWRGDCIDAGAVAAFQPHSCWTIAATMCDLLVLSSVDLASCMDKETLHHFVVRAGPTITPAELRANRKHKAKWNDVKSVMVRDLARTTTRPAGMQLSDTKHADALGPIVHRKYEPIRYGKIEAYIPPGNPVREPVRLRERNMASDGTVRSLASSKGTKMSKDSWHVLQLEERLAAIEARDKQPTPKFEVLEESAPRDPKRLALYAAMPRQERVSHEIGGTVIDEQQLGNDNCVLSLVPAPELETPPLPHAVVNPQPRSSKSNLVLFKSPKSPAGGGMPNGWRPASALENRHAVHRRYTHELPQWAGGGRSKTAEPPEFFNETQWRQPTPQRRPGSSAGRTGYGTSGRPVSRGSRPSSTRGGYNDDGSSVHSRFGGRDTNGDGEGHSFMNGSPMRVLSFSTGANTNVAHERPQSTGASGYRDMDGTNSDNGMPGSGGRGVGGRPSSSLGLRSANSAAHSANDGAGVVKSSVPLWWPT